MVELPFPALRTTSESVVPLASIAADTGDDWREAMGEDDNSLPVQVRWDPLAVALAPVAGFDLQIAIAVPLVAGPEGLPTPAEEYRLVGVGEQVRSSMERDERGRLVLVVTTAGVREYVGYSDDDAWLAGWAAEMTSVLPGAQVMSRRDPGWTTLLHSIP
ncbi:MAG: DUF695 domain-containing protein [Mycobacteriales bacterium]